MYVAHEVVAWNVAQRRRERMRFSGYQWLSVAITWNVGQRCRELDNDVSVRRAHDVVQVGDEHFLDLA